MAIVTPADIKTYLCTFIYPSIQFPKPNNFFLHETFCLHTANLVALCNVNTFVTSSSLWRIDSPYCPLCDIQEWVHNHFFFLFVFFSEHKTASITHVRFCSHDWQFLDPPSQRPTNSYKVMNDDWSGSYLYCQSPNKDTARICGAMIAWSDMVSVMKDKNIV